MLNSKSFLALDLGAATLKLAEFEPNEAGGLRLKQYALRSLGPEGMQESTRGPAVLKGIQAMLAETPFTSRDINVSAPGYHVFSKFVKLPPVDSSKVTQIIQYEAQQNVPFPLDDVVWDYQILGTTPTGELEVLLVAIKREIVEGIFKDLESIGLNPQLMDVGPAALCNAFRYNYSDLEGCTMLLDIGAKTSNLIFFEGENVYSRGINIGANSITVDFSKESKLGVEEAERVKIADGFVGLAGAYEEPDDPHQAAISKIARQVMTRLHIQVNQTIQFYRGQQGGSAPQRLLLSGGATSMPYTAEFFNSKLSLPVDYFNPFRNLQIDPALNVEELAKVGHSMGEVVGVSLRSLARCPVELNLMPRSTLQRQQLKAKRPYLFAAAASLVLIIWAFGWFYAKVASSKQKALDNLIADVEPRQAREQELRRALEELAMHRASAEQYGSWLGERNYWINVLDELRRIMISVEAEGKTAFKVDTGMWIESFEPGLPAQAGGQPGGPGFFPGRGGGRRGGGRFGGPGGGFGGPPQAPMMAPAAPAASPDASQPGGSGAPGAPGGPGGPGGPGMAPGSTNAPMALANAIQFLNIRCRLVDLKAVSPDANTKFAYMFEKALSESPFFIKEGTRFGQLEPSGDDLTFMFQATLTLAKPVRF